MKCSIQPFQYKSKPSNSNSERSKYNCSLCLNLFWYIRLWHDIADNLVNYFKDKTFDKSENRDLLTLYEAMVSSLASKLNPLKYALITVSASRQYEDFEEAIEFLEKARTRLEGEADAQMLCRIAQAEKRLNIG